MSWRLPVDLAHRRKWVLGIGCDVGSFALQALALAFGPLALVQPLLVTGLLFAVPLAVRWRGRRLGPREWAGTVAGGGRPAGVFAAPSPPRGGAPTPRGKGGRLPLAGGGPVGAGAVGRGARGGGRRAPP